MNLKSKTIMTDDEAKMLQAALQTQAQINALAAEVAKLGETFRFLIATLEKHPSP